MQSVCERCHREVEKLIALGDVQATAWLSTENNLLITEYDYLCVPCTLDVLNITESDLKKWLQYAPPDITLLEEIELQKNLMIGVATGGPRIQDKNDEYKARRLNIRSLLSKEKLADPNPYTDLWAWYSEWSAGDLKTWQSRREFVANLYLSLVELLSSPRLLRISEPSNQPTGWERVDRCIESVRQNLETASSEEQFQMIGLLCREAIISLAQAVFDPVRHKSLDGVAPSETDANRMLENYFASELSGSSNEASRRHAKAALALANELQHRRTANLRDAALCTEATRTVVNIVAILSGKRDR